MAWRRIAAWRHEITALVGPPVGSPAIVVSLRSGRVRCRVVSVGAAIGADSVGAEDGSTSSESALRSAIALPFRDTSITWAALWLLGDASPWPLRRALLADIARVLVLAGTLVIVDHNRPRRRVAALAATLIPPRPPGATPAAAWQRLAYPTARDAYAAGLVVDRLRLAAGERVQVIFARRVHR